jgi:hypothetical protein
VRATAGSNAAMERLFGTLKSKLAYQADYATRQDPGLISLNTSKYKVDPIKRPTPNRIVLFSVNIPMHQKNIV